MEGAGGVERGRRAGPVERLGERVLDRLVDEGRPARPRARRALALGGGIEDEEVFADLDLVVAGQLLFRDLLAVDEDAVPAAGVLDRDARGAADEAGVDPRDVVSFDADRAGRGAAHGGAVIDLERLPAERAFDGDESVHRVIFSVVLKRSSAGRASSPSGFPLISIISPGEIRTMRRSSSPNVSNSPSFPISPDDGAPSFRAAFFVSRGMAS